MNPSKTLRTLKRIRARYPSQQTLEDEQFRESQQYYRSLSTEELEALYNEKLAGSANDPEMIANRERWSKMTVEELTQEYFQKLKAC
jgi:hypothetical protein